MRADFPLLDRTINGHRLVYVDSAATSQKPRAVLDAMEHFYEHSNANVHRGAYTLANEATEAMEQARRSIRDFIGAPSTREVIFTRNATEALNLVARSWGGANLGPGDAVLLSMMEHHANIVPWHMMAADKGFEVRWIPLTDDGHLDLTDLDRLLDGVKLVGVTAASNVLGTLTPVRRLADAAHAVGALIAVDGCQLVPHLPVDVTELGADFFAFSAHKMCGPTGIGALWARAELLEAMDPFMGGGEMIVDVRLDGFTANEIPWKFEAGTPAIAEAVGFGASADYLTSLGMDAVRRHEVELMSYAMRTLAERFGDDIVMHGPSEPAERSGVLSFSYKDVHPHDMSQVLDQAGVCVRAGHHCAKPLMKVLEVGATCRASFYVYNDTDDVDALVEAIAGADDLFGF